MDIDAQVATESTETAKKPKRDKKEVSFASPIYAKQLMTEEGKKNFDALPSWQRHLIKRIVDHGDVAKAAEEAGVSTYIKKNIDVEAADKKTIVEALNQGGLDNGTIVQHLLECLEAKTVKFDKHQNPIPCTDLSLKLKTIETICKLKGLFDREKGDDKPKGVIDMFKDTEV